MKFIHKAAIVMATAATVLSCVAFAGCNGTPAEEAKVTGVYGSGSFSFFSAYPGYTYKQLTTSTQTLTTYSNNRYELTVTSKNMSGNLSFDPEDNGNMDTSGVNDRGQTVVVYCGTYTLSEEEGILTLSLAKPDGYISVTTGNSTSGVAYYNTDAWTESMSSAAGKTAEEYLVTVAFSPVEIIVDLSTYGFDFVTLTVAE